MAAAFDYRRPLTHSNKHYIFLRTIDLKFSGEVRNVIATVFEDVHGVVLIPSLEKTK